MLKASNKIDLGGLSLKVIKLGGGELHFKTISRNSPENYYYITTNNLIDSFKTIQLLLH